MTALEMVAKSMATRITYRIVAVCGDEEKHLGQSDADHMEHLERFLAAERAALHGWQVEVRAEQHRWWITGGPQTPTGDGPAGDGRTTE